MVRVNESMAAPAPAPMLMDKAEVEMVEAARAPAPENRAVRVAASKITGTSLVDGANAAPCARAYRHVGRLVARFVGAAQRAAREQKAAEMKRRRDEQWEAQRKKSR